jgi:hypothetical protein
MKNDEIPGLLDRYVDLAECPRNQELLKRTWARPNLAYIQDIGIPAAGEVPIIANPFVSMWAKKLKVSIADLYLDPETYLRVWLGRDIFRFVEIQDDRPLNKRIVPLMGTAFESSMFGARQLYSDDTDPWPERTFVLESPDDLDRLELPDFYESGMMPLAHRFYNELSEMVKDHALEIVFPYWGRSPWDVAVQLRGHEKILTDMILQPDFVRRLVGFLNQSAIHYHKERAKFLGIPLSKPEFANDEVGVPNISPRLYRGVLLPLEKEYAAAFGGLVYWHSCNDVTPLIPLIREIPDIAIFHCGPRTDVVKAAEVFGDFTLDICVDSLDVYRASEDDMRAKVTDIVKTCREHGAHSFSIRPGILQAFGDLDEDLNSIVRWARVAKETVAELVS